MRMVAMLAAAILMTATTASAQSSRDSNDSEHRLWKVLIGSGAIVAGTAVAAKSSTTTKTSGAFGVSETSEFSKSQLITGLAVAGTGGFLLWDGLRDRHPERPSTRVAIRVGKRSSRFLVQRVW